MSETTNDSPKNVERVVARIVPPDLEGVANRAIAGAPYPLAAGYNEPAVAYVARQVSPSKAGMEMSAKLDAIFAKMPRPPRTEEEIDKYDPPPMATMLGFLRDVAILVFGPHYRPETIEEAILPRLGANDLFPLSGFANRNRAINVVVEPSDDDPNATSPAATAGPNTSTSSI